jgi:hypothetical protein
VKNCWKLKLLICASLVVFSTSSFAGSINFDTLLTSGSVVQIPNGYSSLAWNNFYVVNATASPFSQTGYFAGLKSRPNDAFNGNGTPSSFSAAQAFTLQDGFFTGAWNDNLNLTVTGLLNGVVTHQLTLVLSSTTPLHEVFHWTNVNKVEFNSFGGTANSNYAEYGSGTQFVVDNLNVTGRDAVPEPGSLLLLGSGVLGLAGVVRRKLSL